MAMLSSADWQPLAADAADDDGDVDECDSQASFSCCSNWHSTHTTTTSLALADCQPLAADAAKWMWLVGFCQLLLQLTFSTHNSSQLSDSLKLYLLTWTKGRPVLVRTSGDQGPDLRNILWQSYDNATVTIDLRWMSHLPNILRRMQGFT